MEETEQFNIGDIVALKGNMIGIDPEILNKWISAGSTEEISPIMIIVGLHAVKKDLFDSDIGKNIAKKGTFQCNCLWFSTKSFEFKNARISSNNLKIVKPFPNKEPNEKEQTPTCKFEIGQTVRFVTAKLESKKQKISKDTNSNFDKITNVETFVAPTLEVIGVLKNDKEYIFDSKLGDKDKIGSSFLVKCKYFNSKSDKMSEYLLPFESIEPIKILNDVKIIKGIQKLIDSGNKFYYKNSDSNHLLNKTLLKAELIFNQSGECFLKAFDYAIGRSVEYLIDNDSNINSEDLKNEVVSNVKDASLYPTMIESDGKLKYYDIVDIDEDFFSTDSFFYIKYKDLNGTTTKRIVYNARILELEQTSKGKTVASSEAPDPKKEYQYLKANCLLRNREIRYFRMDRISLIQKLELNIKNLVRGHDKKIII